eukprot:TRINITY_DN442_c2_g1_i1.p1 TRINITY_DN442_c2_g1~~TRINITY_DN442_c2_g1_i1.p1  ORF type:complete len:591 (+),score=112.07 TRINITY_DN442_c2_g1_i1:40-1812(+)
MVILNMRLAAATLLLFCVCSLRPVCGERVNHHLRTEITVYDDEYVAKLRGGSGSLRYESNGNIMWSISIDEVKRVLKQDDFDAFASSTFTIGSYSGVYSKSLLHDAVNAKFQIFKVLQATNRLHSGLMPPESREQEWMRGVQGKTPFFELTIPGTHDSGAIYINCLAPWESVGTTQCDEIKDQLELGIRFLDIRLTDTDGSIWNPLSDGWNVGGLFTVRHGELAFGDFHTRVWEPVIDFLIAHPFETVVMSVKKEVDPFSGDVFLQKYLSHPMFMTETHTGGPLTGSLPLEDMRGRIVFVRRSGFDGWNAGGLDWEHTRYQDMYDLGTVPDFDRKEARIKKHFKEVNLLSALQNPGIDTVHVNFASAQTLGTLIFINSLFQNNVVEEFITKDVLQGGSIVPMDYPSGDYAITPLMDNNDWLTVHRGSWGDWGSQITHSRRICGAQVRTHSQDPSILKDSAGITALKLKFCREGSSPVWNTIGDAGFGEWWKAVEFDSVVYGATVKYAPVRGTHGDDLAITELIFKTYPSGPDTTDIKTHHDTFVVADQLEETRYLRQPDDYYFCGAQGRVEESNSDNTGLNGLRFKICEY